MKWVIERNRFELRSGETNGLEYGRILWIRDCSGKLHYHKETLAVMKDGLTPDSPIYLHDLLNYVNYLVENKESQEELNLSFEEKALIIGNTLYFVQLMAKENKYQLLEFEAMGHFYKFHDHKDEYGKEFAKKIIMDLMVSKKCGNKPRTMVME